MSNNLKERYPGEYKDNLERKKEKRRKAAEAQEQQRKRLLVKAGTRPAPKPDNLAEITALANHRAKAINGVQVGRCFSRK